MKTIFFALCAALFAAGTSAAGELLNGDFKNGLANWTAAPASAAAVEEAPGIGRAAALTANGAIASLTGDPVELAPAQPSDPFVVELDFKNEDITVGSFGISLYAIDANNKQLKQVALLSVPATAARDWRKLRFRVNGAGKIQLPEGTAKIAVRFSFWNPDKNPAGRILVANVMLKAGDAGPAAAPAQAAEAAAALVNGDFKNGLEGWLAQPAGSNIAVATDPVKGQILRLTADGANAGVESAPVGCGDGAWVLTLDVRGARTGAGTAAVSVKALDKNGKMLKQHTIARDFSAEWKSLRAELGPGGKFEFPEGTVAISVRTSFWAPKGEKPAGFAELANVTLTPAAR